jgi:hypothetical protein
MNFWDIKMTEQKDIIADLESLDIPKDVVTWLCLNLSYDDLRRLYADVSTFGHRQPGKLFTLINRCKNSITIEINDHRDVYETVDTYIPIETHFDIEPEIFNKMMATDSFIRIQFYPDTAVAFYTVYHYDLDLALDQCLEIIKKQDADRAAGKIL